MVGTRSGHPVHTGNWFKHTTGGPSGDDPPGYGLPAMREPGQGDCCPGTGAGVNPITCTPAPRATSIASITS